MSNELATDWRLTWVIYTEHSLAQNHPSISYHIKIDNPLWECLAGAAPCVSLSRSIPGYSGTCRAGSAEARMLCFAPDLNPLPTGHGCCRAVLGQGTRPPWAAHEGSRNEAWAAPRAISPKGPDGRVGMQPLPVGCGGEGGSAASPLLLPWAGTGAEGSWVPAWPLACPPQKQRGRRRPKAD